MTTPTLPGYDENMAVLRGTGSFTKLKDLDAKITKLSREHREVRHDEEEPHPLAPIQAESH